MSDVNAVFELLDAWRHLPSYQLERRADIFFALYLPKVLSPPSCREPVARLIPEFPLRLKTLGIVPHKWLRASDKKRDPGNLSFKADYLFVDHGRATLVELKTELLSRNDPQDEYLDACRGKPVRQLIEGVKELERNSKSKGKYAVLLQALRDAGLLDAGDKPTALAETEVDVLYLQPARTKSDAGKNVICFEEFAVLLRQVDSSSLAQRFADSLQVWSRHQAGTPQPSDHACVGCRAAA